MAFSLVLKREMEDRSDSRIYFTSEHGTLYQGLGGVMGRAPGMLNKLTAVKIGAVLGFKVF